MEISLIVSFLLASVLLSLMPGPDILLVITESISSGRRRGLSLALGLCSGIFIHTTIAATGLGLIVLNSSFATMLVSLFGAAYLLYLAWSDYRAGYEVPSLEAAPNKSGNMYKRGFIMNVLNPKVAMFFFALLPQFISPNGWNPTVQMLVLGLIFLVQGAIVMCGVALLASQLREFLTNRTFFRWAHYFKICILVFLAIGLIVYEFF